MTNPLLPARVTPELLTPAQVCQQLAVSKATLSRWRVFNTGPKFVNLNNIPRYRPEDIEAFIEERTR